MILIGAKISRKEKGQKKNNKKSSQQVSNINKGKLNEIKMQNSKSAPNMHQNMVLVMMAKKNQMNITSSSVTTVITLMALLPHQ